MLKRYQVDYQLNGDTMNTLRTECVLTPEMALDDIFKIISVSEWSTPDETDRVEIVALKFLGTI